MQHSLRASPGRCAAMVQKRYLAQSTAATARPAAMGLVTTPEEILHEMRKGRTTVQMTRMARRPAAHDCALASWDRCPSRCSTGSSRTMQHTAKNAENSALVHPSHPAGRARAWG